MIDLDDAEALCPGLPAESARPLAFRAMVALQRRHAPGVALAANVRDKAAQEEVQWAPRPAEIAATEDFNKVTEEGAEALALALAWRRCGWRVRRRLQASLAEGADWLMASGKQRVLLEVSGTDAGDLGDRYRVKVLQARAAPGSKADVRAACVVRFVEPQAKLWSSDGHR